MWGDVGRCGEIAHLPSLKLPSGDSGGLAAIRDGLVGALVAEIAEMEAPPPALPSTVAVGTMRERVQSSSTFDSPPATTKAPEAGIATASTLRSNVSIRPYLGLSKVGKRRAAGWDERVSSGGRYGRAHGPAERNRSSSWTKMVVYGSDSPSSWKAEARAEDERRGEGAAEIRREERIEGGDMGRCGEIARVEGQEGRREKLIEIWGDMGRCGEMWGDHAHLFPRGMSHPPCTCQRGRWQRIRSGRRHTGACHPLHTPSR